MGGHATVTENFLGGLDERVPNEDVIWMRRTVKLAYVPVIGVHGIDDLVFVSYVGECVSAGRQLVGIANMKPKGGGIPMMAESLSTSRIELMPVLVLSVS